MDAVRKLETKIALWYKDMPHLPRNGRRWLARNIWWIVLVGVIICALGIFGILSATFLASTLLTGYGGVAGAAVGAVVSALVMIYLGFLIVETVVMAMAISPLRMLRKKGWELLFVVLLLNAAWHIVSFLFNFNVFALIWDAFFIAVGAYFLFEIRSHFAQEAKSGKKARIAKA